MTEQSNTKYLCQFSPDGKHWINQKISQLKNAWEFLTGKDAQLFRTLNKEGKLRIINQTTKAIIGDNIK